MYLDFIYNYNIYPQKFMHAHVWAYFERKALYYPFGNFQHNFYCYKNTVNMLLNTRADE